MKKTTYAIIALVASGFLIIPGMILIGRATNSEPEDSRIIVTEDVFEQVTEDADEVVLDDTMVCETPDTNACNQADTIQ